MILENIRRNAREGNARFGDIKKKRICASKRWEEVMRYGVECGRHRDRSTFPARWASSKIHRPQFLLLDGAVSENEVRQRRHRRSSPITPRQRKSRKNSFSLRVSRVARSLSSAYQLALDIIKQRYRPEDWNIYPFHFSDGDNYYSDNEEAVKLADELIKICNLFGYGEIGEEGSSSYRRSSGALLSIFSDRLQNKEHFVGVRIDDKEDVCTRR